MDSISVTEDQEYLVFNSEFTILRFSPGVQKYAAQTVALGQDIRLSFPEIVGLEATCQEIRLGQQESFVLETISRTKQPSSILYFNLYLKAVENCLAVFLEDVTESTLLQQSSMQKD